MLDRLYRRVRHQPDRSTEAAVQRRLADIQRTPSSAPTLASSRAPGPHVTPIRDRRMSREEGSIE